MRLGELLDDAVKTMPAKISVSNRNAVVEGLTENTKELKEGYIFVCIKGKTFDGHDFAEEMLESGAVCVITERDLGFKNQVIVENTRKFYGLLCSAWFEHPERHLKTIGVTGTNGKTTAATLMKDILTLNDRKVGFIGTTGVLIKGKPVKSDSSTPTTPRVYELYQLFHEMIMSGCDVVVMEVSSFALEQNRIGPLVFDAAIFTNLTQDHLDYHENMENYYQAKKKLFTEHCQTAIINIGDEYGYRLYNELGEESCERISYGLNDKADIYGDNIRIGEASTKFWISVNQKSFPVTLNMIGQYNVSNAISGIIACLKMGLGITNVIKAIGKCKGVRGRCEILTNERGFMVVCDYAHSPDALENMLSNIKEHTKGRLICLFGCGGDRDNSKRPLMAKAVEKYADILVITSDNPRNEDPDIIIDQIIDGLSYKKSYIRIPDRRAAIKRAIYIAEKGDTIVLAGKGHEDYQILKDGVHIHFDEREIVAEIMNNYKRPSYNNELHESMEISEIIDAIGGIPQNLRNLNDRVYVDSIFSDTRAVKSGGVFIALKGERFDGHDFAQQAVREGALFAITERDIDNCPTIVVKSTRKALLELAHYYRMKFNLTLVGITGSVGKTTTKNMVALALSAEKSVYKTQGNHNNEIGLPFTLFNINSSCSAAVIEMGMSDFGEIERLSRTAHPTICLITNIGYSHIENLGTQEGILQAKLEIIKGSDRKAPLIVNGDEKLLWGLNAEYEGYREIITYGIENKDCDFTAENITMYSDRIYYDVVHNGEIITDVSLFCIGRHNIYNSLAAIVVAYEAGVDPVAAAEMLSAYQPDEFRQNIQKRGEHTIIVDCYNASPTSMKAAIDMLCEIEPKEDGRRVAVLGDMFELGEDSSKYHEEIGEYVAQKGLDLLVCYGNDAKYIAKRADELGMHAGCSDDKKMVLNFLKFKLKPNDVVLFKASRGVHLEEIIDEFYKDC